MDNLYRRRLDNVDNQEGDGNIISFLSGDFQLENDKIDESLLTKDIPILPLRNTVVFPGSSLPIAVGREKSLKLIKSLSKNQKYIGLVSQKDLNTENPVAEEIYKEGVIAEIIKVIEISDNSLSIIVQAKKRFEWKEMIQSEPFFKATYSFLE